MFPVFLEGLLGYMKFCHWLNEMLPLDIELNFLYLCRNLVRIRQDFLSIVFCKVVWCIYMQVPFLGIFGKVSIFFLNYECF